MMTGKDMKQKTRNERQDQEEAKERWVLLTDKSVKEERRSLSICKMHDYPRNESKMEVTMKVVYFARSYNSFNSNNHHQAFWMCRKIIQYALAGLWVYEYDLYQMCMWESHLGIKDM